MSKPSYYLVGGSESNFTVDLGDIQGAFTRKIQSYFPDNPVLWVSLDEVRRGLSTQVAKAALLYPGALVVSLSSLYYPYACLEISPNRIVNEQGQFLGLGARPGSGTLRQQVEKVMREAGERPIIVADDTLFHGETLECLRKMGLRIDAAVEFFTDRKIFDRMTNEGFTILTSNTLDEYVDVLPLHDFLPMLPLCGKVVGSEGDGILQSKEVEGCSLSLPYLLPWITPAQLEDWSCIPAKHAVDFSTFALAQTIVVADRLRSHGYTTVGQAVKRQPPRRSIPCQKGRIPNPDMSVSECLGRSLHCIGKYYGDGIV